MTDPRPSSPWWKPEPLTWLVWMQAAWCGVIGWIGMHRTITDSDPAGNGMATGYVQGLSLLGLVSCGVLVAAWLLIRWRPARYVVLGLLALLCMAMVPLVG